MTDTECSGLVQISGNQSHQTGVPLDGGKTARDEMRRDVSKSSIEP